MLLASQLHTNTTYITGVILRYANAGTLGDNTYEN
jgi:hypothetical protein